jgi:hypothetical protein
MVTNHTLAGEDVEPLKNMSKGILYDEVGEQTNRGTMSALQRQAANFYFTQIST